MRFPENFDFWEGLRSQPRFGPTVNNTLDYMHSGLGLRAKNFELEGLKACQA